MKKRILSVILAATMAFTMAVGTFTVVNAADSSTPDATVTPVGDVDANGNQQATGSSFGLIRPDVTTNAQGATIQFSVPYKFTVGLDPFQAGDASGSQIFSMPQGIYNRSNIPIRVVVKAGVLINNTDVSLKSAAGDVDSSDITNIDKDAYIELVAEKATATTDREGNVVVETVKLTGKDYATAYDPEDATTPGALTTAKNILRALPANYTTDDMKDQVCFGLAAATYAEDREGNLSFSDLAADNKGVAAFRFMGSLNANAPSWSNTDLEVKVIYDVNGMSASAYDALMTAAGDALKAVNVYSVTDVA